MITEHTDNFFEKKVQGYISDLELLYHTRVEEADNKAYAKSYYRSAIFERNPRIPKDSIFFTVLSKAFLHFYRLNRASAIFKTFDELPEIKDRALLEIELLKQMNSEEDDYFFLDRIGNERYLMQMEYHELTDLLAYFLAVKTLLEKYPKPNDIEPFSLDAPIYEVEKRAVNHKHEYSVVITEKHQLLAVYFILEHLGIRNRVDVSMTKVANLVHLLTGKSITKIDNSSIYGNLKKLFKGKPTRSKLKDLEFVLPFFTDLELERSAQLIQREIKEIKGNLPE